MNKKMWFKIGLTVIVLTAWFMYYAIKNLENEQPRMTFTQSADTQDVDKSPTEYPADQIKQTDTDNQEVKVPVKLPRHKSELWQKSLHIAVVSCGDRLEETLVMLKSAVLFSKSPLVFHIFADADSQKGFQEWLDFWPPKYLQRVQYFIYNLSFPEVQNQRDDWQLLFKPCASQRLFIPDLLWDVDAVVYVDTDVLFLSPVDHIWSLFSYFNSSQMSAVSPEHEDHQTGWYNRFARHPFYGELGVNSGVMLMNLTRIRASAWPQSMVNLYVEYKLKITFGDQDLINIYFHFHPDELYVFGCEWNYRPDHCMYMSVCKQAERLGVYVLHGCRRVWHNDKQPAFRTVYQAFKQHRLGASVQYDLLEDLVKRLEQDPPSNCGSIKNIFLRQIQNQFTNTSGTLHS